MSRNGQAFDRYLEINRIFNLRKGETAIVTTEEMLEKLGISERQWREDVKKLKEMGAPLAYDGRKRGWRYTEPFNFSDNIPLTLEDIYNLRLAVSTLAQLNHIADFKDLPETVNKIRKSVGRWVDHEAQHKAIYFDPLPHYEGSRHLPFFMEAIEKEHQVQFDYLSFQATAPKNYRFDPYFLRQHHQRWYVGGWSHDPSEQFIRTFPLERIEGEPVLTGSFIDFAQKPKDFNPVTYWQHVIGINRPAKGEVEAVILQFNRVQGKYFESQPFYQPYQILEKTEEKLVVQLDLMIEIELKRKIASYGDELLVLSPASLKEEMARFFQKAAQRYGRETN